MSFSFLMSSTSTIQQHEKLAYVAKKKDMSRHVGVCVGVVKFLNVATYDFSN